MAARDPSRSGTPEQKGRLRVDSLVNRAPHRWFGLALFGAAAAAPAVAGDPPTPSLTFEPIVASGPLSPVEEARSRAYRLDPGLGQATGQRAKLSLEVGDSTLFAITGKLARKAVPTGPLDPGHARALGQRRDSGKVYGAGVARHVSGVDLSATYQHSKLGAEQPGHDDGLKPDGPGKSHSLRATARIRFRP